MDLNEVATFVRAVEDGSFSEAARELGVPRSTVSRRIARLEEELGVRLFQRTTRRMTLTDEGAAFFERVGPAVAKVEEAANVARDMGGAPRGLLRISAPVDLGHGLLGELTADFVRAHPEIQVEVSLTGRHVDLIHEGFDMALRAGRLADSSLIARKLGSTELCLFASPDYVARRGLPATPDELEGHDAVLFKAFVDAGCWTLTGPDEEEVSVPVTGLVTGDEFAFLRRVTVAGGGICLMPRFLGMRDVEGGKLVRVLEGYRRHGGGLYVVYPSARYLPAKVRLFRDFLVERVGGPEGMGDFEM